MCDDSVWFERSYERVACKRMLKLGMQWNWNYLRTEEESIRYTTEKICMVKLEHKQTKHDENAKETDVQRLNE